MIDNPAMSTTDFLRILDCLDDGILIFDEHQIIVFCNKAASQLYQLTESEIMGKCGQDLVEKGYLDHSFSHLAFDTKKSVTYEQTTKSGNSLLNTAYPLFQEDGCSMVLEQIRNLKSIEFYAPDSALVEHLSPVPLQETATPPHSDPLVEFKSAAMQSIYRLADSIAPKNINVFILGRSGTGKSQLAQRIHRNSARKSGPFVTINCAAIPEALIESELFGYLKGAFSGASAKGKQGLIETAQGGTLFLDEIAELPLPLQSKLLQFIQEKTYTPIGGVHPIHIDTRIIAATNRDISALVSGGSFREDLYYRLATVTILLPPLKDRPEDKRLLLKYFCSVFCLKHGSNVSFSTGALDCLCHYSWPGNIREMEHLVEFLVISCQSSYITPDMLPAILRTEAAGQNAAATLTNLPLSLSKPALATASNYASEPALGTALDHTSKPELTAASDYAPEPDLPAVSDYAQVSSLTEFLDAREGELIRALYPTYNTSYQLSKRLQISQSTANRLIRKHIKKT